jgi:hypothetical protein
MATPGVAGAVALFRQALSKNDKVASPCSSLLKATLIASTDKARANPALTASGFGYPVLKNWVARPHSFVAGVEVKSGAHLMCSFTLSAAVHDLRVAFSYLDPPLAGGTYAYAFFASLALSVKPPVGGLLRGNGAVDEFSTNQEVVIAKAAAGAYEIHVVASEYPTDNEAVKFSLAVVGADIGEIVFTKVMTCDSECAGSCVAGRCSCASKKAGPLCDKPADAILAADRPLLISAAGLKEVCYFTIEPAAPIDHVKLVIHSHHSPPSLGARVCLGTEVITNLANPGVSCQGTWVGGFKPDAGEWTLEFKLGKATKGPFFGATWPVGNAWSRYNVTLAA